MVERDVVLAKIAVIDRCINRINHVHATRGGLSQIVERIVENHLGDLQAFAAAVAQKFGV